MKRLNNSIKDFFNLTSFLPGASLKTYLCLFYIAIDLLSLNAHADLEFKKKVIENCDEAKTSLALLEKEKQHTCVEDLRIILKLATNQIEALSPEGYSPNNMIGVAPPIMEDLKEADAWKMLQPNKELRAKRCATEILYSLRPHSLDAVPDMIKLSHDRTIPNNFQRLLNDVTSQILIDASNDSKYSISPKVIQDLIEILDTQAGFKAQNALLELQEVSVPILINELAKPDSKRRDLISAALLHIDSKGDLISTELIKLLNSADDGLRKRVISILVKLESQYPFIVPAFIAKLDDVSPDITNKIIEALEKILNYPEQLPKISLDKEIFQKLLQAHASTNSQTKHTLAKAIARYGPTNPNFPSEIIKLAKNGTQEDKSSALYILGTIAGPSPEVEKIILGSLFDNSPAIRSSAANAIGNLSYSSNLINTLERALRLNQQTKDPATTQRVLDNAATSLTKLKLGKNGLQLVPYFTKSLSHQYLEINDIKKETQNDIEKMIDESASKIPSIAFLSSVGEPALASLLKQAQSKDGQARLVAILVVAKIKPSNSSALKPVIAFLNDSDPLVRQLAEYSLTYADKNIIFDLKKLSRTGQPKTQGAVSRLLTIFEGTSNNIVSNAKASIKNMTCIERISLFLSYKHNSNFSKLGFDSFLIECLNESSAVSEQAANLLVSIAPINLDAKNILYQNLVEGKINARTQITILENAIALGLSQDETNNLLIKELKNPEKSIQIRIINIFSQLNESAKQALPSLLEFFANNQSDLHLANETMRAIIAIDPSAYDFTNFLLDGLKSSNHQWSEKSITKLPPQIALPILNQLLNDVALSKRNRIINLMASFGGSAKPYLNDILQYIDSADLRLSYASTIAAAKIDPTEQKIISAFKRALREDTAGQILNEEFPHAIIKLLNDIATTSPSKTEKHFANLLAAKIENNK